MSLAKLRALVDGRSAADLADLTVTGITNRSGEVRPGDLYAAVPGTRTHGAKFAAEAQAAGAVCVLTDAEGSDAVAASHVTLPIIVVPDVKAVLGEASAYVYGAPASRMRMLGITATSGKTTTAYLMYAGLAAHGHTVGLIGTVETLIGTRVIAHVPGSSFTTPEAPDLHALLAVMVESGVDAVVMEVSSHALQLGRVAGIGFDVAGFANLSQDHLDFHLDMESYFAAKSLLFDGRSKIHVCNIDDQYGARVARLAPERTVSISPSGLSAAWRATEVDDSHLEGCRFVVNGPDSSGLSVELALPGRFNVANGLMAIAMLAQVGVPPTVAVPALRDVVVPGRMQRVVEGQDYLAVVDYAHKPAAVSAALSALRPQTAGRLIVVLGCGGDRDQAKRPLMGEVGARQSDVLIVTDDNPRSEAPDTIRAQMLDGARAVPLAERAEVIEEGDRGRAIELAVARARSGDCVLVAGKGHEHGQYVGDEVLEFDDTMRLRAAISASRTTRRYGGADEDGPDQSAEENAE
ncbi:UDP-N-acetylmuramoylalanyl-D-glutamate--2,6-diaminopimelate ligase [Antricoccus suffuscus]|uniref:UDP-N-acetylmuramoyl-L-alanyl-D-glutamate--2,6-diaminopimelate ligase n=2 Tax=Antricoccus suffuscus TaxID=1629062 RepID=A0A2T0ZYJ2_9ACTN|nr:UDP-N-acetylmuramoylalanyl-D-glutamate--2,6-diaminopimelate ligase [Antricoccus suffuscus]